MKRETGKYIKSTTMGETVKAFVPFPLPPDPSISITESVRALIHSAEQGLTELKIASELVPNIDLFTYSFVRKEAIYSSQIEGIQATLTDLLSFEASPNEGEKNEDILEVCNYLAALNYGRRETIRTKGLPLSLRLIRETHRRLMKGVRGSSKMPGEFRTSQNWIGGTRPGNAIFVPPPPNELSSCLDHFERFLYERDKHSIHPLIGLGLVHAQFETIHPFLDGNGRLGRLLISLLMESWGMLDARLLYPSYFFKRHQSLYYQKLTEIRTNGDWEGWIEFFLEGISETASEGTTTARSLFNLIERDRQKLLLRPNIIVAAIRLFERLADHPIVSVGSVVNLLKVTKPTAGKAIDNLVKSKILKETTGAKRNRLFGYKRLLGILKGSGE